MLVAIGDHPNTVANKRGTTELRQYVSSEQDLAIKILVGLPPKLKLLALIGCCLVNGLRMSTHGHTHTHTHTRTRTRTRTRTVYVATTVALNTYTHSIYIHIRPMHSTETHSR